MNPETFIMSRKRSISFLYINDEIDEEEYAMFLQLIKKSENAVNKFKFDLESVSETNARKWFRFAKADLPRLKEGLRFPDILDCGNRLKVPGLEALCIVLRRLAIPDRLVDLKLVFGRSYPELSAIVNTSLNHIWENCGFLLTSLDQPWLTRPKLREMADAVFEKSQAATNCIGFVDGKKIRICRPSSHQRSFYSGHIRDHALTFQSVMAPNGLVIHLFGPVIGSRHDAGMMEDSNLIRLLKDKMQDIGELFHIYGDQAYKPSSVLWVPFKGVLNDPRLAEFNLRMSRARVCVEWGFGKISNEFNFTDYYRKHRILLQPVGMYYRVAALLANCHTCLYGSISGKAFVLHPPQLEDYLQIGQ